MGVNVSESVPVKDGEPAAYVHSPSGNLFEPMALYRLMGEKSHTVKDVLVPADGQALVIVTLGHAPVTMGVVGEGIEVGALVFRKVTKL